MPDFKSIQDKWQKKWEESKIFNVAEDKTKKKFYCLEMFPYPSASFLHMGHVRNFSIGDVIARFKRMNGYNVLYPMGFDSFGLPAENASKKAGIHPREYTENAIIKIVEYLKELGLSYDWDRMIATHRPEYYKWNQYFFIKFFEKGLAYRKKASVNYCNHCKTVLANEEVENGKCWRCENDVVQKELDQWFLKTTAYADELLNDLDKIDWPEKLKTIQQNWIGKSHGVMIDFKLENGEVFPIFTTRPDTIYGVTFMVIALNHSRLKNLVANTPYENTVSKFAQDCKKAEASGDNSFLEKSGVFTGKYAINPVTNEKVPIYAGNFIVADYATGIIMAVPAHDQRDFEFAKKYSIDIKKVIQNKNHTIKHETTHSAFTQEGTLINSQSFNGMDNTEAIDKISEYIEKNNLGKKTVNYKLKDWLISRQRYWGTPIPIVYCEKCGAVPLNEKDLPLLLPEDVDFSTLGNPILTSKSFMHTKCPKCSANATRETDTMGGFMDSSWYFLRYCSPDSEKFAFDQDAVKYWMPVDQYVGGIEHAVGHLIYSRWFVKVLRDLKMLDIDEPFNALFNQGVVYKDGHKMSKSHGNIVTQDEISKKYGIDTARIFMLFTAAPDKEMEWSDKGIEGSYKMLSKIYKLFEDYERTNSFSTYKNNHMTSRKNFVIKNITNSIVDFKLNSAIMQLMDFANYISENKYYVSKDIFAETLKDIALLLNPFAPHVSEECWMIINDNLNNNLEADKKFASIASWPEYREELINMELHYAEDFVENIKSDVQSVLELAKIENPSTIEIIISDKWKYALYRSVKEIISRINTKNNSEIIKEIMKSDLKRHGQDIMKIIPKIVEKMPEFILGQDAEKDAIDNYDLGKIFKCSIKIIFAEDSKENKAKQAMPGKPAIIVK